MKEIGIQSLLPPRSGGDSPQVPCALEVVSERDLVSLESERGSMMGGL